MDKEFFYYVRYFIKENRIASAVFALAVISVFVYIFSCNFGQQYISYINFPVQYLIFPPTLFILSYTVYFYICFAKHYTMFKKIYIIIWITLIVLLSVANFFFVDNASYYGGMKRGVAKQCGSLMEIFHEALMQGVQEEEALTIFSRFNLYGEITLCKIQGINKVVLYHNIYYATEQQKKYYRMEPVEYKNTFAPYDKHMQF